jgi:hypothetical protein
MIEIFLFLTQIPPWQPFRPTQLEGFFTGLVNAVVVCFVFSLVFFFFETLLTPPSSCPHLLVTPKVSQQTGSH